MTGPYRLQENELANFAKRAVNNGFALNVVYVQEELPYSKTLVSYYMATVFDPKNGNDWQQLIDQWSSEND